MEVEITPIILSGTMLKLLFDVILTIEIVMRKSALKIGMILQKSEWLASLYLVDTHVKALFFFTFLQRVY